MKEPRIIPAVIATDQTELDTALKKVAGFAPLIQLDVMDGLFVPGRSLDFEMELADGPCYQAHLMVRDHWVYIRRLRGRAETIVVHVEGLVDVEREVDELMGLDGKLFLALNPGTPVSAVAAVLDILDGVLVMTVNPGRYGGAFLPECLDKVEELKGLRRVLTVEVDGGMVPETVRLARERGVDLFTSGSYIMKSVDPLGAYRELERAAGPG